MRVYVAFCELVYSFYRSLVNQDGQLRYNMDEIAEVLLVLWSMGEDEELKSIISYRLSVV